MSRDPLMHLLLEPKLCCMALRRACGKLLRTSLTFWMRATRSRARDVSTCLGVACCGAVQECFGFKQHSAPVLNLGIVVVW